DLCAHGLVRPSFIPDPAFRELRQLTRYRRRLTELSAQQVQRIDKTLEATGIKIGAVMSDTLGVSGRLILTALIQGAADADMIAELAKGRL
ncbi:IS110 family transposase, partial [Klebsiella pneumoniae]|nr:IS110 family transposase [Klebsiella pneumoniae]